MPHPSSPESQPDRRRPALIYGLWAVLAAMVILGVIAWRDHSAPPPSDSELAQTHKISEPEPADPPPPTSTEAPVEPIAESTLKQILDDYMVPGRMVFFQAHLSESGAITLKQATGAMGRAKPARLRNEPGWIRVDAYDANDQLTFSQTVEDPTRRFLEHPSSSDDGRMTRTIIENESGNLFIRVPGESLASRLVLSRWAPTSTAPSSPWQSFTTIEFP